MINKINNSIKLVIWDLDDTLWRGTLAEGDRVELIEGRKELIDTLNRRGIVNAICSKNDFEKAKSKLIELNMWELFVFPTINFNPKGQTVKGIIADMQLRAPNVLFVDDNESNLNEMVEALDIVTSKNANEKESLSQLLKKYNSILEMKKENIEMRFKLDKINTEKDMLKNQVNILTNKK